MIHYLVIVLVSGTVKKYAKGLKERFFYPDPPVFRSLSGALALFVTQERDEIIRMVMKEWGKIATFDKARELACPLLNPGWRTMKKGCLLRQPLNYDV